MERGIISETVVTYDVMYCYIPTHNFCSFMHEAGSDASVLLKVKETLIELIYSLLFKRSLLEMQ